MNPFGSRNERAFKVGLDRAFDAGLLAAQAEREGGEVPCPYRRREHREEWQRGLLAGRGTKGRA